MNRYPLWKNLLVFGVIARVDDRRAAELVRRRRGCPSLAHGRRCRGRVGARADSVGADGERQSRTCLPSSKICRRSCASRPRDQSSARDVLTKALPNHVVALTLSPRTPGWLKALGLEPMLLGLDLRGGVHFLYEVDLDTAVGQYLETYETRPAHAVPRARTFATTSASSGTSLQVAIIEPARHGSRRRDHPRARYERPAPAARPAHEPAHRRPHADRRPPGLHRARSRSRRSANGRISRSSRTR